MTNYTDSQIERINEVFHDIDADQYAGIHPEIFTEEAKRWQAVFTKFLPNSAPIVIGDIGCGTGFIGLQLQEFFKTHTVDASGILLDCLDISQKMLDQCQENLHNVSFNTAYKKLDSGDLGLRNDSYDVLILNSVLHHIPNAPAALQQLVDALKPGGVLYIGHEPNRRFAQSTFLRWQYYFLQHMRPKPLAARLLRLLGLYGKVVVQQADPRLERINNVLLQKGVITAPLATHELSALVDIHSFSAGGMHINRGFDPTCLFKDQLGAMENLQVETYNHFGKLTGKLPLLKPYHALLKKLLPYNGATFFVVAKKV